jgi:hypothetical protein
MVGIINWYQVKTTDWRIAEYGKLASLKSGYSFETFKEKLGAPLFQNPIAKTEYTDNIFRGRDYWVQVITDQDNRAMSYAVTSCKLDFQPTFLFGEGGSAEGRVTLNRSLFPEVMQHGLRGQARITMGVTSNSYVFEFLYGGNPSDYKTYAWGMNDACPVSSGQLADPWSAWRKWAFSRPPEKGHDQAVNDLDEEAQDLLSKSTVNTYAETAPFIALPEVYSAEIGVDRILIRTVR